MRPLVDNNNQAITADHLDVGKYVLAAFHGTKTSKHFAGVVQAVNTDDDTAVVSFFKNVGNKQFVVPTEEDVSTIDICDLVLILPNPSTSGGTERTCKKLAFFSWHV